MSAGCSWFTRRGTPQREGSTAYEQRTSDGRGGDGATKVPAVAWSSQSLFVLAQK